jgi:hypothetical protein
MPDLARLADEVQATQRPRVLRRANQDVAVLTPLPVRRARITSKKQRDTAAALAVVARTAGALASDIPFPGIEAERAAAMAADARRER